MSPLSPISMSETVTLTTTVLFSVFSSIVVEYCIGLNVGRTSFWSVTMMFSEACSAKPNCVKFASTIITCLLAISRSSDLRENILPVEDSTSKSGKESFVPVEPSESPPTNEKWRLSTNSLGLISPPVVRRTARPTVVKGD